jgi:AraC-like DNA-binding protein
MAATQEPDFDERVTRIVTRLLRTERADEWLDAQRAAEHLKMSRYHFLRLCRNRRGPEGHGERRLKRWRRSVLDAWQIGAADLQRLN